MVPNNLLLVKSQVCVISCSSATTVYSPCEDLPAFLDLDEKRLEMAKELGADFTILVQKEQSAKEVAAHVRELLNKSPNKVVECTGAESSINTAIYVSFSWHLLTYL